MKTIIRTLAILTPFITKAQTPNLYVTVTNLWYQGHKAEVLPLGQNRLNINTNDMPGLLIKFEYEMDFSQLNYISNTIERIAHVGAGITNVNFKSCFRSLKEGNDLLLLVLSEYHPTPEELTIEQTKGLIPNKPFSKYKQLEALQEDGLFEPIIQ